MLALWLPMISGCAQYMSEPREVSRMVIEESIITLRTFRSIPELAIIDQYIPDAAGIIIFPRMIKGGLIAGVESGTGVLMSRTSQGWSYPGFYLLSAASIGFQVGLQESSAIMIIRNTDALNAVIEQQGKFGAEMGLMLGWNGVGYGGSTTTSLGADIVAFTGPGFGIFGGVAMEGAALVRRTDLNEYYYGVGATPRAIVLNGQHSNGNADALRAAIDPR